MVIEHCPRCIARAHRLVTLLIATPDQAAGDLPSH
jgi:hypothetical protein